jgi:hypothetical protein
MAPVTTPLVTILIKARRSVFAMAESSVVKLDPHPTHPNPFFQ